MPAVRAFWRLRYEWGFEASLEIIEFQADLDYMLDYVSCYM